MAPSDTERPPATPPGSGGERPVFVVGAPRSGTTLLRTLIDAHPEIALANETHWLLRWASRLDGNGSDPEGLARFWAEYTSSGSFRRLRLDPDAALARIHEEQALDPRSMLRSLLRQHAEAAGKPRWGEKTPAHYAHLGTMFEWFPDASVLFAVRDPRAVTNSHVTLPGRRLPADVDDIARQWVDAVTAYEAWAADPRIRQVRYESLVADPAGVLEDACGFLGVDFAPQMLESKKAPTAPPGHGRQAARGSLSSRREVSAVNTERWREGLLPAEVAIIEHVSGPWMRRLGYEPDAGGMRPAYWARLALVRALRVPRRAWHSVRQGE
jgi:hypothetical protein